MPVCGLVITLDSNMQLAESFLTVLARDPRITLGDQLGARLAIATETDGPREQRALHQELLDHPAVVHVDTTFAEIGAPDTDNPPSSQRP